MLRSSFRKSGMKAMNTFLEIVGWYGAVALLFAYFALARGWLQQDSRLYHMLNFTGAIGLGVIAFVKTNYQNVVVEIFWGGIALVAFIWPPKPKL